jgi:hypothetical protein
MVVPLKQAQFPNYALNPEWMVLHPPSHFWPEEKYTDLFSNKEAMQWPARARVPTPPPMTNTDLNDMEREALESEVHPPPLKMALIEKNWKTLEGIPMMTFLGKRNAAKGARGTAPTRFVQHPMLEGHFMVQRYTHHQWKPVSNYDLTPFYASPMNRNRVWVVIEGPHAGRYCMGKRTNSNEENYLVKFVSIELSGDVHVDDEEAGIPKQYLVVIEQTPEKIRSNPNVVQESKYVDDEEAGIPKQYLVVIEQTPEKIRSNPNVVQESKYIAWCKRGKERGQQTP